MMYIPLGAMCEASMRIRKHRKSYIVQLADRSVWRIWPADLPKTLLWRRRPDLDVVEIDHEVCSHALVERASGLQVRVVDARTSWPAETVRRMLASEGAAHLTIAFAPSRPPHPKPISDQR